MHARLKRRVRNFLLGSGPVPRLAPVGKHDPQDEVRVILKGLGSSIDVTRNNVVASLRPLTLGLGIESAHSSERFQGKRLTLEFREQHGENRLLGRIGLSVVNSKQLGTAQLHLCRCRSARNFCVSRRGACMHEIYHAYQGWRSGRHPNPYNFRMSASDLRCLFVFYICPRPVVLVTVTHEAAGNIFPMDLIGPVANGYFSLALRNTSPAVQLIKAAGRISLADVPIERMSVAYALGEHHKKKSIDWSSLPFEFSRSQTFGLPVPGFALRVREMEISESLSFGSHTVFLARAVSSQDCLHDKQMFHTNGFYRDWINRSNSVNSRLPR